MVQREPRPRAVESISRIWIPRPREEVFAFFADARNLDRMTPRYLSFEILSPQPIEMRLGTEIDYRLRWHFLSMPWRSRVTVWRPPEIFTYEQARGPYRHWLHEHRYEARGDVTLVIDRLEFAIWGGKWMTRLFSAQVAAILRHRERVTPPLFQRDPPNSGRSAGISTRIAI